MQDSHLPARGRTPILMSQKRRGSKSPLNPGPVSPAGPDFPQALLTSRRPVLPPDRAPFLFLHKLLGHPLSFWERMSADDSPRTGEGIATSALTHQAPRACSP